MPVFSEPSKLISRKIHLQNKVLLADPDSKVSEQSSALSAESKRRQNIAVRKSNSGSGAISNCDKSDLTGSTVLNKKGTDLNKNETGKQKTSSSSPQDFIRSVEILKQAVERKENQIKAREPTKQVQTKQKADFAGIKTGTDKALLVSTSVGEGIKKIKSMSGSLKDELRKTEESIHLLKQTLLERKSHIAGKKNLTEPEGSQPEKQKVSAQVIKQNQISVSQSQQITSVSRSPQMKPVVRTSDVDSVSTNVDTQFISRSPYELVKSKTSPVSASVTHKLNSDRSVRTHDRNFRTHQVKSKYWIRNVKSSQENKDLTENKTDMNLNRMESDLPVFKKTKYSLRRVQFVPGRNSQVNNVINNPRSHSQQTARFIKSKYKINRTGPQRFFKRRKRYFTVERPWAYPYRRKDWKLRKQSYAMEGRKFYQRSRKQWPHTARYKYAGYGVWPYQQFYNG